MRVGLMVNPTAGKGRGAALGRGFADAVRAHGHLVVDVSGRDAADATAQAREAAAAGALDVLAVVGGDGMVHLGVNVAAGTPLPLAVVAAGTGNDVARELRLPLHDPIATAALVDRCRTRVVDAARVTGEGATVRWYAAVLSAGFDALVNERANRMSWPRGRMRYNLAIARELPVFRPIRYTLGLDGVTREVEAMLVAVANGPSFGGGMRVCPDARVDDGLLDVLVVHRISVPALLRVFPKVYSGAHVEHPAVEIVRAASVTLGGPAIAAYADGERVGPLPLTVDVVPGALTVVVP